MKLFGLLAAVVVAVSALLPAQAVTVVTRRGDEIKENGDLRLSEDLYTGVVARKGPATMKWDASEVVEIRFDQAPDEWRRGLAMALDGAWDKAIPQLEAAVEKSSSYAWLKTYGNYYLGLAYGRTGQIPEGIQKLRAAIAAEARHRFVPQAYLAIAEFQLRPGAEGPAAARSTLATLLALPALAPAAKERAEIMAARVEATHGDPNQAMTTIEALDRRISEPESRGLLAMARGQALVRLKRFGEAERAFTQMLESKAAEPEIIAGAANGLGDCQFEQQKYEDAMWSYSRTYSLFLDREDLKSEVGWALYRGGLAFELQAGKVKGEDRKRLESRAGRVLRVAANDFRNTVGGREARTKLGLK